MTQPQKPFAKLQDALPQLASLKDLPPVPKGVETVVKKERKPHVFKKAEPLFLTKVHKEYVEKHGRYGTTKLAEAIGVCNNTITDGINQGQVTQSIERAAESIWLREYVLPGLEQSLKEQPASKQLTATLSISREAWDAVKPWLEQAGARFTILK